MATTILLIRHGETRWNRGRIFRGTHDIELNDTGRAQARLAADALASRSHNRACPADVRSTPEIYPKIREC